MILFEVRNRDPISATDLKIEPLMIYCMAIFRSEFKMFGRKYLHRNQFRVYTASEFNLQVNEDDFLFLLL